MERLILPKYLSLSLSLLLLTFIFTSCADSVSEHKQAEQQHQIDLANNLEPVFDVIPTASINHPENVTFVGTFHASDPEGGVVKHSLAGADKNKFHIIRDSGELFFNLAPNFEPANSAQHVYKVTVIASDALEATSLPLTINIENKNDAPTISAPGSFLVAENTTEIGLVNISDEDGDALTVTIANGDSDLVSWDKTTSVLSFKTPQNYETNLNRVYRFSITATEVTVAAVATTRDFEVRLSDQNDAPLFTTPTIINAFENSTQVDTISASDEDGDTLRYSLSGKDAKSFVLDADSGELRLIQALDYEQLANPNLHITVTVQDNLSSTTKDFTVKINNVFDLDSRFNGDGIAEYNPTPDGSDFTFVQMINTNDNGFLVLGYYNDGSGYVGLLYKLNANGNVDANFGSSGLVSLSNITINSNDNYRIETTSTGNIFLIWSELYLQKLVLHLQKFNSNGTFDTNYGMQGVLVINQIIGGQDSGIVKQSCPTKDGGFLVTGQANTSPTSMAIWKFDNTGNLDTAFASGGAFFDNTIPLINVVGITLTSDGGYAVLGDYYDINEQFAIWKFDSLYKLDTTVGINGILTYPVYGPKATAITGTSDGGLMITSDMFGENIIKVNPQFMLDSGFWPEALNTGFGGAYFPTNEPYFKVSTMTNILRTQDNGFIVGGVSAFEQLNTTDYRVTFWKFNSNFLLDDQFGNAGIFFEYLHGSTQWDIFKPISILNTSDNGVIAASNTILNRKKNLVLWKFH